MGIARVLDNTKFTYIGCRAYMPPEFYRGIQSKKLDVYTYGLTLNETFSGSHECNHSNEIEIKNRADYFYFLVLKCTEMDPNKRPSSEHVCQEFEKFEKSINSAISILTVANNNNRFDSNEAFKMLYQETLNEVNSG